MDIKNIFGINQPYGQNRVGRSDSANLQVFREARREVQRFVRFLGRPGDAFRRRQARVRGHRTAQEAPESRADKVASLKAQVEAGTYQPDSKKIAEKMLTMESELFG